MPAIGLDGSARETEVDSVDLSRSRSHRPVATGRSPAAGPGRSEWGVPAEALIEPSRRDRVRGWFTAQRRRGRQARRRRRGRAGLVGRRPEGDASRPASSPDAQDQGGRAVGTGSRPGRTKQRSAAAAGVAAPRLLLDACASGPPILQDGPPAAFDWVVLPRSAEMVLVLVNRSPEAEVRLGPSRSPSSKRRHALRRGARISASAVWACI